MFYLLIIPHFETSNLKKMAPTIKATFKKWLKENDLIKINLTRRTDKN